MEDFCINCKVFRNINNTLEKINITNSSQHVIDRGYEYDYVYQSENFIYNYMDAYLCDYCKSIFFKEQEDDD